MVADSLSAAMLGDGANSGMQQGMWDDARTELSYTHGASCAD